jgi:hypothetical protein
MSKFKGAQNSAILAIMPTDYWSIPADSAAASASSGTLTLSGNTTITAAQTALYTVYTTTDINITYNLISFGTGTYNFSHATFAPNIHFIDSSGDVDVFGPKNGGWLEGSGSDTVTGGAGNDTVYVAASDVAPGLILNGGLGENVLELADGADISRLKTLPKDFQTLQLNGSATVTGAESSLFTSVVDQDDNITFDLYASAAGTYNFSQTMFSPNVHFHGLTGSNKIFGPKNGGWIEGSDNDTVTGGAGNDTVYVSATDVAAGLVLNGGAGQNLLELADGANLSKLDAAPADFDILQLDGSATISAAQSGVFPMITDQDGNVTYDLFASAAGTYNFSKESFASNVHFHGFAGSDLILAPESGGWIEGSGNDTVTGGEGNDTVYVSPADVAAGLVLNGGGGENLLELAAGTNISNLGKVPANFGILQLDGSATISAVQSGAFPIVTDPDDNITYDLFGSGSGTYDFAKANFAGNVHFHGLTGGEDIVGPESGGWIEGAGADTVTGGAGNDTVYVAPADVSSGLILNGGGGQNLLEAANGTNLSDLKTLPSQFDVLQVDGSATISPSESTLFTFITIPDDNLTYALQGSTAGTYDFGNSTVAPNVQFFAGAGDEVITAAGHNYIAAGVGNDTLIAMNAGGATLVAGTANDVFQLDEFAANNDVIQGFKGAGIAGGDILDLHGFGTGATLIYNGGTSYTVNYSSGSETFTVQTADGHQLTAGDYTFK